MKRNYEIVITTPDGLSRSIAPPLSMHIDLTRNTSASTNSATIRLHNLRQETREAIAKDRLNTSSYYAIRVLAGYDRRLSEVFRGNIRECYSLKQGPDWVTSIVADDGMHAIANGYSSFSIDSGAKNSDVFSRIISDLPGIAEGAIGAIGDGTKSRGQVIAGSSAKALDDLSEGQFYIDSETANVLDENEFDIAKTVLLLDGKRLFTSPRRREAYIEVDTLFLPDCDIGQVCELRSREARMDGQYKVVGFSHSFTVSQATAGSATTRISLLAPSLPLVGRSRR